MNPYLKAAQKIREELQAIRRDIHHHPETGMTEQRTAGLVAGYLRNLGLDVRTGVGGTGVTGTLVTRSDAPTVALRADMDALPLQDRKQVTYASGQKGIAHACGHDGHVAMLLGAAKLLSEMADRLDGNVRFLFQPAEEKPPGGALAMIADGALEHPSPEMIFALHLNPSVPQGRVMVKSGYATISSAGFSLTMIGKGGHVAFPHKAVDPVVMASQCVAAAQNIITRRTDPVEPVILAFGTIHGGTANNIIPDEVTLTGTLRTLRPEDRDRLVALLEETAHGVARINGGTCRLSVKMEYPSVYNDPALTAVLQSAAGNVIGEGNVIVEERPFMGGEDMAYFQQRIPGVLWFLGTANPEKGFVHSLHSPLFDFDDGSILPLGASIHVQTVVEAFRKRKTGP